jgi:hypothetical protein
MEKFEQERYGYGLCFYWFFFFLYQWQFLGLGAIIVNGGEKMKIVGLLPALDNLE